MNAAHKKSKLVKRIARLAKKYGQGHKFVAEAQQRLTVLEAIAQ